MKKYICHHQSINHVGGQDCHNFFYRYTFVSELFAWRAAEPSPDLSSSPGLLDAAACLSLSADTFCCMSSVKDQHNTNTSASITHTHIYYYYIWLP